MTSGAAAAATLRELLVLEPRHWRSRLKLIDWLVGADRLEAARAELDTLMALGADPAILARARHRLGLTGSADEP